MVFYDEPGFSVPRLDAGSQYLAKIKGCTYWYGKPMLFPECDLPWALRGGWKCSSRHDCTTGDEERKHPCIQKKVAWSAHHSVTWAFSDPGRHPSTVDYAEFKGEWSVHGQQKMVTAFWGWLGTHSCWKYYQNVNLDQIVWYLEAKWWNLVFIWEMIVSP